MAILQPPPVSMASLFWDLSREPVPAPGTYLATCIDIQDKFGVDRRSYEDRNRMEKVDLTGFLFGFRDPAGNPFRISTRPMRISAKDNSTLYGFLRSWLGRAPQIGWDYAELKGRQALLTIDLETRRDGSGSYPVIVTAAPVPAGFVMQAQAPAPLPAAPPAVPALPAAAPAPVPPLPPPAPPQAAPAAFGIPAAPAPGMAPPEDPIPF